jgi:hypothetical protein
MWEFRNGQWFNGPSPSPVGPPIGAAFWVTDANGMRDFRTFDGTNTPAATEVIPVNPFIKNNGRGYMSADGRPYGNDDIAINKTPPLQLILQERAALSPEQQALWDADPKNIERIAVARRIEAGLPPNPTTPPVATVNAPPAVVPPRPRPQGIEGYTPPMATSGGPLNQDRTNLFTPPSMVEPRQVNYTTQDMFTPDPKPTNMFQRIDQEGMFGNSDTNILSNAQGNTFDRNLIASIAEAMKNSNPTEAARAKFVMSALSNPAIVGNAPVPVRRDGPTDLISQAGAMFDAENYGPQRRMPVAVTPEEEAANIATGRDKGPNNPFRRMSRMSDGTTMRYPTGTTPNIFDVVRAQRSGDPALAAALTNAALGRQANVFDVTAAQKAGRTDIADAIRGSALGKGWNYQPGGSVDISQAAAARDQAVMNAAANPTMYSSADIVRAAAALQQKTLLAAQNPPPLSPPGAPRRSTGPIGNAFSTTAQPQNPFMRGLAPAANPFVRRFAEGTWDPDWYNKALAITDPKARIRYLAEQNALKSQLTRAEQQRMARNRTTPTTPTTPVDIEALIRQKLENNSLTIQDQLAATQAGNTALATAISRKLAGFPWEYTWKVVTPPPATTTPKPGPQVIWYDGDVWKDLPSLNALNNTQQINPFSRLGSRSSYDPATETTIQAPEKMNAFTMMQIDRDPQQLDVMNSIYDRHGRNWEKEYADAIRAAPMGNATRYVKTG